MAKNGWHTPLALAAFLAACGGGGGGKSKPQPPLTTPAPPNSVNGIVADIGTGARLANVTVSGGGKTVNTAADGTFTLANLPAGPVNLTVSRNGYAPGYATAQSSNSAADALIVNIKTNGTAQNYDPTTSQSFSQVTEAGPYRLTLSANSLDTSVTTDTTLSVNITPLDPTKEVNALPGNLVSGGSQVLLPVTFAEFSIQDSVGTRINLNAAASATVELPIPPALRANYPDGSIIHCYAYDPVTGQWADFVNGTVGPSSVDGTTPVLNASIRHFSWYGGAPQGTDCVDTWVRVLSAVDGTPLGNARVEATPGTVAYTDADGWALVRTAVGGPSTTFTAYQTGIDVSGSLTGMPGAKFIEFGRVDDELTGLVQKPCSDAIGGGDKSKPVTVKVGVVKNVLYEANAFMTAATATVPGQVFVSLQQGVPDETGQLQNPTPADGAIITLTPAGGTPLAVTGAGSGTGGYFINSAAITAGGTYTLEIDADGNGSIDGSATVVAVGELAWTNPTDGATVSGTGLVASWTDTGTALGGPGYAPIYEAVIDPTSGSTGTSYSFFLGTDLSFAVSDLLNPVAGSPLTPGDYTASLWAFSGFTTSPTTGFTVTNNITGAGITGVFWSFSTVASAITFTVQ
jgi:hypothetical protein